MQVTYIGDYHPYEPPVPTQASIGWMRISPTPDAEWRDTWRRLAAKYGDEAPVLNADLIEIQPTLEVNDAVRHALELIVQTNDAVGDSA